MGIQSASKVPPKLWNKSGRQKFCFSIKPVGIQSASKAKFLQKLSNKSGRQKFYFSIKPVGIQWASKVPPKIIEQIKKKNVECPLDSFCRNDCFKTPTTFSLNSSNSCFKTPTGFHLRSWAPKKLFVWKANWNVLVTDFQPDIIQSETSDVILRWQKIYSKFKLTQKFRRMVSADGNFWLNIYTFKNKFSVQFFNFKFNELFRFSFISIAFNLEPTKNRRHPLETQRQENCFSHKVCGKVRSIRSKLQQFQKLWNESERKMYFCSIKSVRIQSCAINYRINHWG